MKPNFETILIHCSSLSKLMTEPQKKIDKEAGNLSATAKGHLIEVYAEQLFDFKKELDNKYIRKGNEMEGEAIEQLGMTLKLPLEKNQQTFSNEYFIGTPDIDFKPICLDTKCSYDWLSFLKNIDGDLDDTYEAQMQGYLDLLGYTKGYIAYLLLDTPIDQIQFEHSKLLRSMNVISEESPEFIKAWEEKEKSLIFSNQPIEDRILLFEVNYDADFISNAKNKVEKAREFLESFWKKHKSFNQNTIKNIIHETTKQ
jgi:hypothetical protein